MNEQAACLAVITRSGRVESQHFGHLVVCDTSGSVLYAFGDPKYRTYMRSSAKPFQAMNCLLRGAGDRYGWRDEELAIVCASHSAQPQHTTLVRSILAKAELTASDLQCGPHPPIDADEREALTRLGQSPTRIHSNCSGKHAGMLACCRAAGWPTETYRDARHPLQIENLELLARIGGLAPAEIGVGVDGCGVPTFHVPMDAMATAFARLSNPVSLDASDHKAAKRVAEAMIRFPQLIAGRGRFNSLLGEFAKHRLVAKSGAEGVFCVGIAGAGLGLALKVSDGSSRVHPAILADALAELMPDLDWSDFGRQANLPLINTRGEAIGTIEPAVRERMNLHR